MPYNPNLKCQALSKRDASKFRPNKPTLLIAIQDGEKSHLPFKERTNYITRSRYTDTLFCFFDDIDLLRLGCQFQHPFLFSKHDANTIINFLDRQFSKANFEQIIVHCQAGISRSQAVALFIAKYYYKDEQLVADLKANAPLPDGNLYIYQLLETTYLERFRNSTEIVKLNY